MIMMIVEQYSKDPFQELFQFQLENLMRDGEQLPFAEYAAANALDACPQSGTFPLTRNDYITLKRLLRNLPNEYINTLFSETIKRKNSKNSEKDAFL